MNTKRPGGCYWLILSVTILYLTWCLLLWYPKLRLLYSYVLSHLCFNHMNNNFIQVKMLSYPEMLFPEGKRETSKSKFCKSETYLPLIQPISVSNRLKINCKKKTSYLISMKGGNTSIPSYHVRLSVAHKKFCHSVCVD